MPQMPAYSPEEQKEREVIIRDILDRQQIHLNAIQNAGNLPPEIIQKVSLARINSEFGVLGDMMNDAKKLQESEQKKKQEDKA